MKADNPFDRLIKSNALFPPGYRDAVIDINDTLYVCWVSAQSVFGRAARPEHALAMLPIALEAAERRRAPGPSPTPTSAAPKPRARKARSPSTA